jgi:hypothetical protein
MVNENNIHIPMQAPMLKAVIQHNARRAALLSGKFAAFAPFFMHDNRRVRQRSGME